MTRINESEFPLENGEFGKIAIFMYSGSGNPSYLNKSDIRNKKLKDLGV